MAATMDQRLLTSKERLSELTVLAESVHIDHAQSIPSIIRYYVSSKQLFETSRYEAKHGNNEKAYTLIMRFLDLFVTRIPKHPKFLSVPEHQRKATKALCKEALALGAELKQKLLAEYDEERRLEEEELARQRNVEQRDGSAVNLDDLVDRIGKLNAAHQAPASSSESSWPKFPLIAGVIPEGYDQESWAQYQLAGVDTAWPTHDASVTPIPRPRIDRSTKPRSRISSDSIRTVRLPGDLVSRFGQAASENTAGKNIETCGNLWGKREGGVYVVTHVLIPKQKGTDSYCEDLDEGMVAEYAITRDLIQLGWIHTHPSQTAFLSSVDTHMQHGYQIMLPEAIAIVLAPSFNDIGIFRLTDHGMEVLAQCRQGTTFHTHDESMPLFERVDDVVLDETLITKLEDFRLQ